MTYMVGSKMPDEIMNLQMPGLVPLGFVAGAGGYSAQAALHGGAAALWRWDQGQGAGELRAWTAVRDERGGSGGTGAAGRSGWLVARTPAEFAEKLVRVHEDEAFNQRLSEAGLAYIEQRHGAGVVKQALAAALA